MGLALRFTVYINAGQSKPSRKTMANRTYADCLFIYALRSSINAILVLADISKHLFYCELYLLWFILPIA
jgi:hypothetical protein